MKTCTKCGEEKSLGDFYKRSGAEGKYMAQCKDCTKSETAKYRVDNEDKVSAYEAKRRKRPERIALSNEIDRKRRNQPHRVAAYKAAHQKYKEAHPERVKARDAVGNAVRDGHLIPWTVCAVPECGDVPEAHHPDYSRPLDVVWLCCRHHKDAHNLGREIERMKGK